MIKVKSKLTNKIYYFRFFSENKNIFYYTPTTEANKFNFGFINNFEPIGITWEKIRKTNEQG